MAVDTILRWQLVRDVIVQKKTGLLVLQSGKNYLNWRIEEGNLVCVSSTSLENSLTKHIEQTFNSIDFFAAQNDVNPSRSIGSILVKRNILTQEQFTAMIQEHWIVCTDFLFQPSIHLFWSANPPPLKAEFIRCDRPLSEVLIQTKRTSITIPTALRTVQDLKGPFRIAVRQPDERMLNEEERRICMYLQSGTTLDQIFQDREISKIPCYKTIFLLWICGYLCETRPAPFKQTKQATSSLLNRIPPEWIFPLCAGTLIGVILAPTDPPASVPAPDHKIRPLHESIEKPVWAPIDGEEESPQEENSEVAEKPK